MDLLDMIRFENETTRLDFKATLYRTEQFDELLKDVMAMANAPTEGDRYVVMGIKHYPGGERDILGVDNYVDDSTYQQLVLDNIEPEISLEYSYLLVGDKTVSYFRIFDCGDQPYMAKKDRSKLKRGDCYIRKGTSKMKLMRSDIDRIFQKRQAATSLVNKIEVAFLSDELNAKNLRPRTGLVRPSEKQANNIRAIIADKEQAIIEEARRLKEAKDNPPKDNPFHLRGFPDPNFKGYAARYPDLFNPSFLGMATTYEQRDVPTLKEDLELVADTYAKDDLYYIYEEKGHKINFLITNAGNRYVENCLVKITIKRSFDFSIAKKVHREPSKRSTGIPLLDMTNIRPASYSELNYPEVEASFNDYSISQQVGDLKHNLDTKVFKTPIRLFLPTDAVGNKLELTVTIFGKNLPTPYIKTLVIDIV